MTLTTERLKELLEELKSWQYGYDPVDDKEQFDMLATAEWAVIELLANREAQPVAYLNKFSGVCMTLEQQPNADDDVAVYSPLYTAPPAPAVPGYDIFEDYRAEMLKRVTFGGDGKSSGHVNSPAIPDGWIACSERMPELDKRVLLYFGSYDGHIEDGCIGDDGDGPYHYFFDGDSLQQEPTHWMPLPAAPEGGNG
ncbi:hypothetical protein BVG90_15145 [Serratia marcescens]|uniref:DUF551 domain-containing protein n=1 Tax=Serratia marcescens TaxID=615 RepID=UPI000B5F580D|nr:DUF551 domain-containing protein [Serratia marcescens]ASM17983.1 hypothetical protein BVG90_15145 [Serratia marcescens]